MTTTIISIIEIDTNDIITLNCHYYIFSIIIMITSHYYIIIIIIITLLYYCIIILLTLMITTITSIGIDTNDIITLNCHYYIVE